MLTRIYMKYVNIWIGKKITSIANINIIYWSVCSYSRRGGDGPLSEGIASRKYYFIRVHENLVQHHSNYLMIGMT